MADPAEKREPSPPPKLRAALDPRLIPFVKAFAALIVADLERHPVRK